MSLITGNAKSLIAAAIAFLGGIQIGLDGGLTAQETIGAVIAGLVSLGAVFAVPNKGQANVQAVVDQVKALVPPAAAQAIDDVVPTAGGVLKDAK